MRWATLANRARQSTGAGAADPEVPERGRRAVGPATQGLIAFIVYLVVFVALFGHALLPHLNVPKVGQDKVDPNFYVWAWGWWPYALTHGLNPLHSHLIGAPGGYNLAWATTVPAVAVPVWPITAAAGPIAAFNVTLLLAPPASAWAAFVAARKLTGKFWPALLAGTVYGFSSYELSHDVSGQPNLTVTLLPALMVYLVLLWWDGTLKRTGYVIWMAVAVALEFYTFVEAFAEITILCGGGTAHRARGRRSSRASQDCPAGPAHRRRICRRHRLGVTVPVLRAAELSQGVRAAGAAVLTRPGEPGGPRQVPAARDELAGGHLRPPQGNRQLHRHSDAGAVCPACRLHVVQPARADVDRTVRCHHPAHARPPPHHRQPAGVQAALERVSGASPCWATPNRSGSSTSGT